jgi:hypothetical protein
MSGKKREKQEERDLYDMSEGDEEYMPEEDDSYEACLGKREIVGKDVGAEAKRVFAEMEAGFWAETSRRMQQLERERKMGARARLQYSKEVTAQIQKAIKPSNDGIINFAGKLYKLSSEGELEEYVDHEVKKGFEELQKLAKKYTANDAGGANVEEKLVNLEEREYRQLLKERKNNLKSLVTLLNNRHRNVSAIFKSKIDWKKYTEINKMDKQFEMNRKDGFIEKQKFIHAANLKEKQQAHAD